MCSIFVYDSLLGLYMHQFIISIILTVTTNKKFKTYLNLYCMIVKALTSDRGVH